MPRSGAEGTAEQTPHPLPHEPRIRVRTRAHAPLKIIPVNKVYKSSNFRANFVRFGDPPRWFDRDQGIDGRLGARPGRAERGAEYRFRALMIHNLTFVVLRYFERGVAISH